MRAAIVTGASRGIGFALAEVLCQEGLSVTLVSRRLANIKIAEEALLKKGYDVTAIAANVGVEADIVNVVRQHQERYGRLDVLVNNAGGGVFNSIENTSTNQIDLQLGINLRSVILFYKESLELLSKSGAEHSNSLVVNVASVVGKVGVENLAVYSAAKHGIVGFTQSMNRELHHLGIKSCAVCPAFVDTQMSDYIKDEVPAEEMIKTSDVAEMFRALLKLSRWCVVPEIVLSRPGDPGVP